MIDEKEPEIFFIPVLVAGSCWCFEIGNMRELGEEPGKELEEFICSGSCHVDLVFVLLEREVSSRALPSRKPPLNDLES